MGMFVQNIKIPVKLLLYKITTLNFIKYPILDEIVPIVNKTSFKITTNTASAVHFTYHSTYYYATASWKVMLMIQYWMKLYL